MNWVQHLVNKGAPMGRGAVSIGLAAMQPESARHSGVAHAALSCNYFASGIRGG